MFMTTVKRKIIIFVLISVFTQGNFFSMYYDGNIPMSSFTEPSPHIPSGDGSGGNGNGGSGTEHSDNGQGSESGASQEKADYIKAVKEETACKTELSALEKTIKNQEAQLKSLEIMSCLPNDVVTLFTERKKAIMESYNENRRAYASLQEKYTRLENTRIEKANAYVNALTQAINNNTISETSENLGVRGDPVITAIGSYYYDIIDFIAQDYLEKFNVSRKWIKNDSIGSFGVNWSSSLDSRIIRFRLNDEINNDINLIYKIIETSEKAFLEIDNYNKSNPKYQKFKDEKKQWKKILNDYSLLKEKFLIIKETNDYIDELNKYVSYGIYSNQENLAGWYGCLAFVDENCVEHVCNYEGEGKWVPIKNRAKNDFYILGLNENYEISNSFNYEGGFVVSYKTGMKLFYNRYGQLIKKLDRNQNQIEFFYENGRLRRIKNKTGEELVVNWNNKGQIIQISGSVSGTAFFSYENNRLMKVIDNNGIQLSYSYSNQGDLTEIKKADNSTVLIRYEYNNYLGYNVVSSVTNENGQTEYFEYDAENKSVYYIDYLGHTELLKYDDNGYINFTKKQYENGKSIQCDEEGYIQQVKSDAENIVYFYDDKNYVYGQSPIGYNETGGIKYYEDLDSFYTEYLYDDFGNVTSVIFCNNIVSKISYYPEGLIKTVTERGKKIEYSYNQFGSMLNRSILDEENQNQLYEENWEYNEKNQLINYTNSIGEIIKYYYEGNDEVQIINNEMKRIINRDCRNRVEEIVEEDIKNGIIHKVNYFYDGTNKIKCIKTDGQVFCEYSYDESQNIKSCIIWEVNQNQNDFIYGIKNEYKYDFKGRLISEKKSKVKKNLRDSLIIECETQQICEIEYQGDKNKNEIKYIYGNRVFCIKTDNLKREIIYPDGSFEKIEFSKAGRVNKIVNSNGNTVAFEYRNDGYTVVISSSDNGSETFYYNQLGLLEKKESSNGSFLNIYYDKKGNIIEERTEKQIEKYTYDEKNRIKSHLIYSDKNELLYSLFVIYEGDFVIELLGGLYKTIKKYDSWNRMIYKKNSFGETFYTYDFNGRCISEKNSLGETLRTYSPEGYLLKVEYPDSSIEEFEYNLNGKVTYVIRNGSEIYKAEYDINGDLIAQTDFYGNESFYKYDNLGRIIFKEKNESGISYFDYNGNNLAFYNNQKEIGYSIEKDKYQNIVKEVFPHNKEALYKYDEYNRLIWKKDFENREYYFLYNGNKINQICGKEEFAITRDSLGRILEIDNSEDNVFYEYNQAGKLIRQLDEASSLEVLYFYDEYGRCIQQKSNLFDYEFEYFDSGKISCVKENIHNTYVKYEYNKKGNKEKIEYSNGVSTYFSYNKRNQLEAVYTKDRYGRLIFAEIAIFDKNGKLSYIADQNGSVKHIKYDEKGRVESMEVEYSLSLDNFYKNEFVECGGFVSTDNYSTHILEIPQDINSQFEGLFEENGLNIKLNTHQESIKEVYKYTESGSVSSVKSLYGEIFYEYDSLNRLISKHTSNTYSYGKKYEWSDNGNLTEIKSNNSSIVFQYGSQNRPVKISCNNLITGEVSEIKFTYDIFGRRVTEEDSFGNKRKILYDGFSLDVMAIVPLYKNGRVQGVYGGNGIQASVDTNDEYRWFDESFNFENRDYRALIENENCLNIEKGVTTNLYVMGEKIATFTKNDSNQLYTNVHFLHTGILSLSVKAITSYDGNCEQIYNYDTWGNFIPQMNNLNNDYRASDFTEDFSSGTLFEISYSGSINTYMIGNLFYDIGYRDYSPEMKSFTTIDRIKSGENWFAYCSGDSINYVDFQGFYKSDLTNSQKQNYEKKISEFGAFNSADYHSQSDGSQIPYSFDCADVSSYIDYVASGAVNYETTSGIGEKFKNNMDSSNIKGAKDSVNSMDFIKNNPTNVKKTSSGSDGLTNPDIVTPGTILVWSNDTGKGNWHGHTLTVICSDIGTDGNVCGIVYIEGHTNGGKTEIGYATVGDNYESGIYNIDAWIGKLEGTFEIEGVSTTASSCAK